jgi:hypothetical protein
VSRAAAGATGSATATADRRRVTISIACGVALAALALILLWRLQDALPGMRIDVASQRYPVVVGESAWQQFSVPACQPTRLTLFLAQPVLTPGALSASYFVRDHLDAWPETPVVTIRTTLIPGQSEVRLPFPDAVGAERRLVRLKLTPESSALAFRAAPDTTHTLQHVTRRAGYLGIESLVFRAEYPGNRWLAPVQCVTGLQFPDLPPAALCAAVLAICALGGWLCGLAWRLAASD